MIRTSLIVTATALCALALPAHADLPAPRMQAERQSMAAADLASFPEVKQRLQAGDAPAALQALALQAQAHENDPAFFNLTGLVALQAQDYPAAVAAFERVVLMQPENAGAWLDLAIAAAEAGNSASALIYFEHLEAEFAPPGAIRNVIAAYRKRITAPPVLPLGWRGQMEVMGGSDTNANSGLRIGGFPLTIGGEQVPQILDPSYQARSDAYLLVGASANYKHQSGENLLEFVMGARQRSYRHERAFSTLDLNMGAGLHRASALGDISYWLYGSDLSLGGSALVKTVRSLAQIERPLAGCRLGLTGEAEWRRYTDLNNLNANLYWGQAGLACEWVSGGLPLQATVLSRLGMDNPTGVRAGGKTRHAEIITQLSAPLGRGFIAELSATFATARDAEGYSALLENNAVRNLYRRYYRFSLSKPVGGGFEVVGTVDESQVRSNLPLFRQQGRTLSLGLRKQF